MRSIGVLTAIASLLSAAVGHAESPKAGEEYEISRSHESSQQTGDGSSGSSSGRDTILERVISVSDKGLELEYDLPKGATADDRARNWQFPARILKPSNGPMALLNQADLETRVDGWLKAAGWTRAMCGRWIFTWNAFRIECDPLSVIKTIEAFDPGSADLREGASYQEAGALAPGTLVRKASGPKGATFEVRMEVNPDAVRRARAESDVVVGEITQRPVTLDAALRKRAKETVSGTILVTFDTDSAGKVRRRTKVTKLETKGPDGRSESETATETIERRRVSGSSTDR